MSLSYSDNCLHMQSPRTSQAMNKQLLFVLVEACIIKVFLAPPNLTNLNDWIISRLNCGVGGWISWHGLRGTH